MGIEKEETYEDHHEYWLEDSFIQKKKSKENQKKIVTNGISVKSF